MEYQLVQKLLFDQFPSLISTFIVLKLFSHHKSPGSIFTSLLQQQKELKTPNKKSAFPQISAQAFI